jgi:coenzyme F420-reducing hydrogenase delta subunit
MSTHFLSTHYEAGKETARRRIAILKKVRKTVWLSKLFEVRTFG